MPLFSYTALDSSGKQFEGTLEASSDSEAKEKLRSQGVLVTSLQIGSGKKQKQLSKNLILTLTMQLSQLISSEIPIFDSLLILEEQSRSEPYHYILLHLSEEIKRGVPLSLALESYPTMFDSRYRSMIAAGEASGNLGYVLEKLSEMLQKEAKLSGQLISSLTYPLVLAAFSIIVVNILLLFVVPTMEELFEGRELGFLTNSVLNISRFMRSYGWILLIVIVSTSIFGYIKLKTPAARERLDNLSLKIPILGILIIKSSLSRYCRTVATLLDGGVSLIEAMKISKGVLNQTQLYKVVDKAEEKILAGSSFSSQLSTTKIIPKFVSQMVAVGEDSGNTSKMLKKIAEIYEQEVETNLNKLVSLAQPIILITMGIFIGLIMIAILVPLTDTSSLNF